MVSVLGGRGLQPMGASILLGRGFGLMSPVEARELCGKAIALSRFVGSLNIATSLSGIPLGAPNFAGTIEVDHCD